MRKRVAMNFMDDKARTKNFDELLETKRYRCVVTMAINIDSDSPNDASYKINEIASEMRQDLISKGFKVSVLDITNTPLVSNDDNARHVVNIKPLDWREIQEMWNNKLLYSYYTDEFKELGNVKEERSIVMTNDEAAILLNNVKHKLRNKIREIVSQDIVSFFKDKLIAQHEDGMFYKEEQ
jgi:hypothetical protein